MARRGNGRQRVVMQRMQKESARQVTFSKRRSGLMKKASELCTLCAAEVLIVVFSPGGKVFSFGHPSTESIIRRFLGEEPEPGNETQEIVQAHRSSKQSNLNFHLTQLESLMDAEKRKQDAIDVIRRETEGKVWWEKPMEGFNLEHMGLFMERVRKYRDSVNEEVRSLQQQQQRGDQLINGGDGTGNGGGGSVFDPKGKGLASGLPGDNPKVLGLSGGQISFDPIVGGGSSSQAPLNPMITRLNGGVPYDPMVVGSSTRALLDPRIHGFNGGGISFDPLASGSSSQAPLEARTYRGIQFDPMAGGSSSQTSLDLRTPGFYGGLTYDPMTAGASEAVPFDQMGMGSAYNPSPLRFQAGASVDPNAPGSSSNGGFGASSFDAGVSDYRMSHGSNQYYGRGFP